MDGSWHLCHSPNDWVNIHTEGMVPLLKNGPPPWFHRKFDVSHSLDLMPNICARLRGTPPRLEEFLADTDNQVVRAKSGTKWSILENVGHLLDLESLWIARVRDYERGSSALTPTDLENRYTDFANYNDQSVEAVLARFRQERSRLVSAVEQLPDFAFERSLMHPRLRVAMSLIDHLTFVGEHDDHHVAQIWYLKGYVNGDE